MEAPLDVPTFAVVGSERDYLVSKVKENSLNEDSSLYVFAPLREPTLHHCGRIGILQLFRR